MNQTVQAMVCRGMETSLAESLQRDGYTMGKIHALSDQELHDVGIPSNCIDAIKSKRPPIPQATLFDLLYRSKSTCCACRDRTKGVVVHHITPWSKSQSHDITNLVVLCSDCHDKAHTKKELTRGLSVEQLRHHKQAWEEEVKRASTEGLFSSNPMILHSPTWDYFHRQRLLDCAVNLDVDINSIPGARHLENEPSDYNNLRFRWSGRLRTGGANEYLFFSDLSKKIFSSARWYDLSTIWTAPKINALVQPNTLVALTANHRFKPKVKRGLGPGQSRKMYYRRSGIQLKSTIDAWECTSNSAYSTNLRGGWVCTALGIVRSLERSDGLLNIHATCLAIGTGFTAYRGATPDVAYTHGRM